MLMEVLLGVIVMPMILVFVIDDGDIDENIIVDALHADGERVVPGSAGIPDTRNELDDLEIGQES